MGIGAAGAAGIAAAGIGAAGSLGSAMMKGSGGSSEGSSSSSSAPWGPQQPYLEAGMGQAANIYGQNQATGPYSGQYVAGPGSYSTGASTLANGFASGTGASIPGQVAGTAGTLQGGAGTAVNTATNLTNGITGPNAGLSGTLQRVGTGAQTTSGPTGALSEALNNSAVSGAQALQGFQSGLTNVANMGVSDPTARIANDAQTYANAPQVQQDVGATNQAITNTLNESTLPTLNQGEAMSGALNSSRSGMENAMAQTGAAQAEGLADAQIEDNALNTGMGTASNLYGEGLSTAESANMFGYNDVSNNAESTAGQQTALNEFNTNAEVGAAEGGLGENLNYENANAGVMGEGANLLGTEAVNGMQGAGSAIADAGNNFTLGNEAGTVQQETAQAGDTNAYDQWQMDTGYPYQNLDNYMQIVGQMTGNYPSQTSSGNQASQPGFNPIGSALGTGMAGYSLFNQLNNSGGTSGMGSATMGTPSPANQTSINNWDNGGGGYAGGNGTVYGGYW